MASLPDFSSQGTLVGPAPSKAALPDFSSQGVLVDQPTPAPKGNLASGIGRGLQLGVMSDWDRAAEALARGAGDVAHVVGQQEWMPGKSLQAKDVAAAQAFRQEYQNQPGFGAGDVTGQIAGTLPVAAIGGGVPGYIGIAGRLLGAAGAGAETGAPGTRGATEGAAVGLGATGLGAGAAHVVGKWVAPEAQRLMQAGVKLTPGQMSGGWRDALEQKLSGTFPILGHFIQRARGQSILDWNSATLNKALASIGEKITGDTKSGYGAVEEAGDKISAGYDKVLDDPNVKFIADKQYADDIDSINKETKLLPAANREQFFSMIDHALRDPEITGLPTGRQLKAGLSVLGINARRYSRSQMPGDQHMAELLTDYQNALRDGLARSNPQAAQKLSALDNAWHHMVIIENAAGRRLTSGGVFMPSDLLGGVKSGANSVRKRSFSRGKAFLQKWANDAQKVLPSKIPDSGTAGRLTAESAITGLAGLAGGAEVPHYAIPAAIGLTATTLPYTAPGIAAVNALGRPEVSGPVSQALGNIGQYSAGPVSGLLQQGNQ